MRCTSAIGTEWSDSRPGDRLMAKKKSTTPDLRCFLSNCLIGGERITRQADGGRPRNRIELQLDRHEVTILQHRDIIKGSVNKLKGYSIAGTELIIRRVSERSLPAALRCAHNVSCLLGFASLSPIAAYGYEYPAKSGRKSFESARGVAQYFKPTIEIRDGTVVRNYLEHTYPQYKKLNKVRRLDVFIDYLINAERREQPVEIQLLMAFVALEGLKHTYAKSRGLPYIKGSFRKRPRPKKGRDTYSFEELLEMMMKDVGMRRGLKRLINLRNEIIHAGIAMRRHQSLSRMYDRCHNILREYLLRLLGYRGTYCDFENPMKVREL